MDKRRVLYIVRKSEGGMKRHLLSLLRFLDKEKYCLGVVCSFEKDTIDYLKNQGIEVFELEIGDGFNVKEDLSIIKKIRNIVREFKADIVHMHGFKASFVGRIACFNLPVKTIVTFHNFPGYNNMSEMKRRALLFLIKFLNKRTDQFIAVSEALKKEMVASERIEEDRIEVIYNCIDETLYKMGELDLRKEFNLPEDSFIVGSIARLIPSKGVQDLIEAAHLIKEADVFFFVAGDGPYRKSLEEKIKEKGIERRFFLLGFRDDIPSFLRNLDVFVLPSHEEGFGISVIEAMNEGVPVVATAVGGIPEIIQEGVNGILVEKGNIESLSKAIKSLLKDAHLKETLSLKGKEAAKKFSCEEMVKRVEELYERIKG